jgi:uncharacterized protein related to proFAR isomerase
MNNEKKELVKGGCGRSEENLTCDAMGVSLALIAFAIVLVSIVIEKLIYG